MVCGGRVRLPAAGDLRLPALFVAVQLAVWPVAPLALDVSIDRSDLAPVAAISAAVVLALCWRVVAPVAAVALAIAATRVATLVSLDEQAIVMMFGDLVAMYGVALRRTLRVSLPWLAVATVTGVLVELPRNTEATAILGYFVLTAAVYSIAVAYGRSRRHRAARRDAVRARVARMDEEERAAAAAERERLTQELHDVSAHHLTVVVVQLAAAQRLHEPELSAQALRVAGSAGRQTVGSLRRLVALADVPETFSLAGIADLVAGFTRLGLAVDLRLDARPVRPGVAEAAYRIVQEALTNALRYAGTSAVTVSVTQTVEALSIVVDDTGAGGESGFDLGSGSGIAGMRARATRLGGTLSCGPTPSGGWSVRASLPLTPATRRPRRWRPDHAQVFDLVLMVCVAAVPLMLSELGRAEDGAGSTFASPAQATACLLFLSLYGGLLWWRRRAPFAVLGGMVALLVALAALSRFDIPVPGVEVGVSLALSGLVAPVYAVGRYSTGHPGLTWMAALAAGLGAALAMLVAFPDPTPSVGSISFAERFIVVAFFTGVAGVALSLVAAPFWLTGWLIARHRSRADRRERVALRDVAERAARAARAERARIAEGLRGQVLQHTSALIEASDGERVTEALEHGRDALGAMRELLTVLRVDTTEPPRTTLPTLAGLPGLCEQGGRRLATLEVTGAEHPVPPEVELCAFRIVEALLPLGGPVLVRVEREPGALRLGVDQLGQQPPRTVLAALRERVDAVGGSLTSAPSGTDGWRLDVSLPITEVVPS
jgi:signal transduction histidine kinase